MNALPLGIRPEFSPLSIVRALWKHKWLIAALSIAGSAATVIVVSRMQLIYQAEAVILVQSQKIPESFVAATVQTALEARLDALKQQVLSRERLWSLIEELKLYGEERTRLTKDEVIGLMRDDIDITLERGWSARGPGAFLVAYQAPNPAIAAEVVNRISAFFINENIRQRTDEAEGASEFLNGQLAEAEKLLRVQENRLKEFKLTYNGELPQQESALLAEMNQGRTELLGIQDALARAQQNKLIIQSSLDYAEANVRELKASARRPSRSPAPADAGLPAQPAPPSELERARSQLRLLRARYNDTHPEVQRMAAEVQRLEREEAELAAAAPRPVSGAAQGAGNAAGTDIAPTAADQETLRAANTRVQELRSQLLIADRDIQDLVDRRRRVLADIDEVQKRLANIPVHEQQLAGITRDYDTSKANYDSLLAKKLAADVATNMERWQKSQKFEMLDPVRPPEKPIRPRRALLISAGTLLSLAGSLILAFVLELRKGVLLGEWELPPGTAIVARIPRMNIERSQAGNA